MEFKLLKHYAKFPDTIRSLISIEVHLGDLSVKRCCRFRKLHPFDSRSPANQNMIAECSLLPFFSSACCATVSSRDDDLKPKSWCCGINSTSCSSTRHIGYV